MYLGKFILENLFKLRFSVLGLFLGRQKTKL